MPTHSPDTDKYKEEKSQQEVSHIAPDIVEGRQHPQGVGTLEIEVALVLVTTRV